MIHFEHPPVCGAHGAVTTSRQLAEVTCPACTQIGATLAANAQTSPRYTPLPDGDINRAIRKEPPMQVSTQLPANVNPQKKTAKPKRTAGTGKK